MLRMQAASNITLRAINKKLDKIECGMKHHAQIHVENDHNTIVPLLPLKTIENIKELDLLLRTLNESVAHFVSTNFLLFSHITSVILLYTDVH